MISMTFESTTNLVFVSIGVLRKDRSTGESTKANVKDQPFFGLKNDFTVARSIENDVHHGETLFVRQETCQEDVMTRF